MKYAQSAGWSTILILILGITISCTSVPAAPKPANGAVLPSSPAKKYTGPISRVSPVSFPTATEAKAGKSPEGPEHADGNQPGDRSNPRQPRTASPKAPAAPPQPATISPLSPTQVARGIAAHGTKGFWPLTDHGRALVVGRKVSASGKPEVFSVFVEVEKENDAEVATLSDFSRLFKENLSPVAFSLVQFNQKDGRLRKVQIFPLGKYTVFESLKIVSIRKGFDMPFAVSATFQTQEGSNDVWVTFSTAGTSRITLRQTLSKSPIVEDIDNDGYLDIIIRERGIEEGTGYETFLTWYKWDGRAYKEYKTTNVVRNLRAFLRRATILLSNDKIEEFFRSSLSAPSLAALRSGGFSDRRIFSTVFHLVPSSPDNPNDPVQSLRSIDRVIFPNIFENPFTGQDARGYSFPMTVRIVTADGVGHFYAARVYMHRNPFVAPQFTFAIDRP